MYSTILLAIFLQFGILFAVYGFRIVSVSTRNFMELHLVRTIRLHVCGIALVYCTLSVALFNSDEKPNNVERTQSSDRVSVTCPHPLVIRREKRGIDVSLAVFDKHYHQHIPLYGPLLRDG